MVSGSSSMGGIELKSPCSICHKVCRLLKYNLLPPTDASRESIRAIQQNFGYFIKRIFMGIEIMNHILVRRRIETSVATPYGNESHYSCRQ